MSPEESTEPIIIVSGLPRSGTSMMMRMLGAGGVPIYSDGVRTADEDNPKGYHELERVKDLEKDSAWLGEARGHAVKIVSPLLRHLPATHRYRIVFMRRSIDEVLASQRKMAIRRGNDPADVLPDEIAETFANHLRRVDAWLATQAHMEVLRVEHRRAIEAASEISAEIGRFLARPLNLEAMSQAVDASLYRQRA